MEQSRTNYWLTLGANIGVLLGILLLVFELQQNRDMMRAQIFNERSGQGIDLFISVAESPELSDVAGVQFGMGTPEIAEAYSKLTQTQKLQFRWFVRADRYRIENLLYQQALGILPYDSGPANSGRLIIKRYEVMFEDGLFGENPPSLGRLRRLISDVEEMNPQKN